MGGLPHLVCLSQDNGAMGFRSDQDDMCRSATVAQDLTQLQALYQNIEDRIESLKD